MEESFESSDYQEEERFRAVIPSVLTDPDEIDRIMNDFTQQQRAERALWLSSYGNDSSPFGVRDDLEQAFFAGPRGSFVVTDILTSALALVGNCLILAALLRTRLVVHGYRRFLLSLTVADLIMAATVMLTFFHQSVATEHYYSDWHYLGGLLLRNLTLFSYLASLLSVAGLTIDNYIGVFKQLRYKEYMSSHRLRWSIVSMWLVSFFLGFADTFVLLIENAITSIRTKHAESTSSPIDQHLISQIPPNLVESESVQQLNNEFQLVQLIKEVVNKVEEQQKNSPGRLLNVGLEKFWIEFIVIGLTIPCFLLILVIYCCIVFKVVKRIKRSRQASCRRIITSRSNQFPTRLILTTLMLISSFTFCWMPFVLFELLMLVRLRIGHKASNIPATDFLDDSESWMTINSILNSLLMLSPLLNPVIYSVRLPRVRRKLIEIVTCYFRKPDGFNIEEYGVHSFVLTLRTARTGIPLRHQNTSRKSLLNNPRSESSALALD